MESRYALPLMTEPSSVSIDKITPSVDGSTTIGPDINISRQTPNISALEGDENNLGRILRLLGLSYEKERQVL